MSYFLGVDGGQSHTTALVADARGHIIGRGRAGPSNHTRSPGGRERLERALSESVGEALLRAGLLEGRAINEFKFLSAHLAMTGETEEKIEIIRSLLSADRLVIGHDAPAALAGALVGDEGIISLAGTGSVAYGETREGLAARVGGHGYLFGDEGSAFSIARQALSGALRSQDRGGEVDPIKSALLARFKRDDLKAIAEDCYAGVLSRASLASFSVRVDELAQQGNETAGGILGQAGEDLAEMVGAVAIKLGVMQRTIRVSFGGGAFKSRLLLGSFVSAIKLQLPMAEVTPARFGPDVGALLLAYRNVGWAITKQLLEGLKSGV